MLLSELFEHLTYGELSQLSITGNGTGILPKDYPVMASHVNLALTALYARLPLREEEAVIQLYDHITDYYLRPQFTQTVGNAPIRYIIDTPENPFVNSVIKVTEVYNEAGVELPLNNLAKPSSVFNPSFDCIQVPYPVAENSISVIYRAGHTKIEITPSTDLSSINVDIPQYLVNLISYFIASNLISPMGENNIGEGNNYLAKYESAIALIEQNGLINKEEFVNRQVEQNGWV